jgi:predicted O-linked N-acetylglucosamine transferase (SPINDLY family)
MSEAMLREAMRLHQAGQLAEAGRLYAAVLQASPRHFQALYLYGFVRFQSGDFAEAERLIGEAIAINPRVPDAFYNRGCALQMLRRNEEAIACFDSAIALKPDYHEAATNRGYALMAEHRHADAVASFDRALTFAPRDAEALSNRGTANFALKRYDAAAADFAKLLSIAPDFPFARGNLVLAHAYACDWSHLPGELKDLSARIEGGGPVLQAHASTLLCASPKEQLQAARVWVTAMCPPAPQPLWRGERYGHEKIRVAYLSADFYAHATSYLLAGVLERHDRSRFEIVGVSFGPNDGSELRARIERACDRFLDVGGNTDAEIAALLRRMEVDIALDVKGFTQDARPGIFAQRFAPVQVNYLAYPGTMGADYIDYLIADRTLVPKDARQFYSEAIAYLPDTYQPTDSARAIAERTPTRAEAGLPENGFVFCSFNNTYKITPAVFAVWMRLLHENDGSVLWLLDDNETAARNLKAEAEARGVNSERLIFAPRLAQSEHLARQRLGDLFLDTLPCNAHTTASDALWAGLPVLTCIGTTFAGRVAASLLHAVGLPELIAESLAGYETAAMALAREPQRLAALREKLAKTRAAAPLFDTARYTRHLERAFATMCEQVRRGEKPQDFAVEPVS